MSSFLSIDKRDFFIGGLMIKLENVTVDFGPVRAVDDVSLHIEEKDVFGIVGFSGAGKSTLVRTINLLQKPSSGKVIIHGEDLLTLNQEELRKKRKKIGMIFQNFNLMRSRTVFENVYYPIRKDQDQTKEEKKKRVMDLLDLVGIRDKAKAYPSQLSGGQQQRCAIARALSSRPEILLCDEATSALDPKTTRQILELLRKVNEQLGLTIVLITHQMEVVKEICNKCAIMEKGVLVETGKTIDIFSNPQKEVTREFVLTASEVQKTIDKIRLGELVLSKDKQLARLQYVGESATQPLISELLIRFGIQTNILAGNIERISNIPVGNLIVSLEGDEKNIQEAVKYLKEKDTKLTLLGGNHGLL